MFPANQGGLRFDLIQAYTHRIESGAAEHALQLGAGSLFSIHNPDDLMTEIAHHTTDTSSVKTIRKDC